MPSRQQPANKATRGTLTDDAELAELLLDDGVVGDGETLAVDLGVSSLVDELPDGLEVDLAVGDVWLDELEHLLRRLGDSDEDAVVDLEESEQLEDLLGLGSDLGDTVGERTTLGKSVHTTHPFSLTTKYTLAWAGT